MNKYIIGIVLLVVGFGGGLLVGDVEFEDNEIEGVMETHEDDGHMHYESISVPEGETAPTVTLEVLEDPAGGAYIARITTTDFQFTPENVSTDHVFGEGHAHIYVDGIKINRVYGKWYHLGELEEGEREIRAELSANDHSIYTLDGEEKIESVVTVIVSDDDEEMVEMMEKGDEGMMEEGEVMMDEHTEEEL